jgi:beta-D-xylosidase 4
VTVTNTGTRDGDEVVQVFSVARAGSVHSARATAAAACGATLPPAPDTLAKKQLVGFQRVAVPSGRSVTVDFSVPFNALASVDSEGDRVVWPGDYVLSFETGGEGAPRVEAPLRVAVQGGAGEGCDGVWARRFPKLR